MREKWHKAKEVWNNLSQRDQRVAAIGMVVVFVFIVYQVIWSPLNERQLSLRKRVDSQQKLLVWMQHASKAMKRAEDGGKPTQLVQDPVMLLGFLQNQIKQAGLSSALKQLKQSDNDRVEMHFQRVQFDKLVGMLIQIVQTQPVIIPQFSVSADVTPGIVNADIYLKVGR